MDRSAPAPPASSAALPRGELRDLLAILVDDPSTVPARFWKAAAEAESLAGAHRRLSDSRGRAADRAALLRAADAEIARATRSGVRIAAFDSADYPAALRRLPDPPPAVWIRGHLPADEERAVAVVGARKATRYGRSVARRLGCEIANAGVVVVSGLARGVDVEAHLGALGAGGPTWAVLGSGLDVVYPPEHRALARSIADRGGAVVSEFPLDERPRASHFPRRNRLIAALAAAVVVVEARRKSGSLITAEFAMDLGKEVGAVPGPALQPESEGTHALLRDGVALVETAADVFAALDASWAPAAAGRAARPGPDVEPEGARPEPSGDAARVLRALGSAPRGVDEIALEASLPASVARAALVELEMDGWVEEHPGSLYCRAARGSP
jgi:DNA processing protein